MSDKIYSSHYDGDQARHCISKLICIILMLICFEGAASEGASRQNRGMTESFTDGLKYAGQMFGINTAADVANLVAKAFSNVATSQKNTDFLSSLFQQRPQSSTASEETLNAASSYEPQNQGTQDTQRLDGVPPSGENVGVDFSSAKLITSVLRMIGFDARKLGALAINALVMIAQAIGTTLMSTFSRKNFGVSTVDGGRLFMQQGGSENESGNDNESTSYEDIEKQPRFLREGTPIDWFLESPSKDMKNLLARATNAKLADELTNLIEQAEEKSVEGANSASCLKMLVCKSSPFIWGMQKSLKKRLNDKDDAANEDESEHGATFLNSSMFFRHLPSLDEFREHGAICMKRYGAHCDVKAV